MTVDANGIKTKDSQERVRNFFDYKKESTKKSWVVKGTDFAGEFEEVYKFTQL